MHIEIGKYYVNKTWKYLTPCLKGYGPTFEVKYNSLFKLAVGIDDAILEGKYQDKKVIFAMIDTKYRSHITDNVLQWFKNQSYLLSDYVVGDIETSRKHMLVLEIPSLFNDSYDDFINGKYNAMYNQTDIDYLFNKTNKSVLDVLNRTEDGYNSFIKKIHNSFGTTVTKNELLGAELDFPIEKHKEIFNYK